MTEEKEEMEMKNMIDKNYEDVWASNKKIRILRSQTPASGKSRTAAKICVHEAISGNNVLCLTKDMPTIKTAMMSDIRWFIEQEGFSHLFFLDISKREFTFKAGNKIIFKEWGDEIDNIYIPQGQIDLVWWEECQKADFESLMNKVMYAPSMRNARHICTGRTYKGERSWLDSIHSSDVFDVFDKSYKDNEYLSDFDRDFLDRQYSADNRSKEVEGKGMTLKDVYEHGTKVDIEGLVTTSYETLDPHGFDWALTCLRNGLRVARKGWNGKGMWLALQRPDENSKMTLPYIFMSTAQGDLVPWLASQTDLLSDDWKVVNDS